MKFLFVSKDYTLRQDGGCAVTRRNLFFLKRCANSVDEFIIPTPSILTRLKNITFNQSYGINSRVNHELLKFLDYPYDLVFFDSSLYGGYLKAFSKRGYKTCCFYHNIESKFYRDKYRLSPNLYNKIMVEYVEKCESDSSHFANYRIVLNERDNTGLYKKYRKKADLILPTSFDPIDAATLQDYVSSDNSMEYILFVGSNFFANVEAVNFLIKDIAPNIKYNIIIVGSICNAYKDQPLPANVELEGIVDDLTPYYVNAICVVNPVFSGSGLKTKTIEALKYGKFIVGTTECFEGIPSAVIPKIGALVNDKEGFIKEICERDFHRINYKSLEVFLKYFSTEAQFERFNNFVKNIEL